MVNSNGGVGEKEIWGKKANWVDYYGNVDGEEVGIAISIILTICAIRPPGWPGATGCLQSIRLACGSSSTIPSLMAAIPSRQAAASTLRYRVLVHHGDDKQAGIASAWQKYAATQ